MTPTLPPLPTLAPDPTGTLASPSAPAIAPPIEPAIPAGPAVWGPEWDLCRWCGSGMLKADIKPCVCGCCLFLTIENPQPPKCRHVCKRCFKDRRPRLDRPGDRIVGSFDVTTGEHREL